MTDPAIAARRRVAALAGHTGEAEVAVAALADPAAVVRVAALRSLARADALTSDLLDSALADPDPSVRIAGLDAAATRPSASVLRLLGDPDPTVVEVAAWVCGERGESGAEAVAALTTLAGSHDDALVRESAVAALGAIGSEMGLPTILAAMTDKPAVRRRAVVALAAFEGPEVDAAWAEARSDHDRQVRDAVDELLGPVDDR